MKLTTKLFKFFVFIMLGSAITNLTAQNFGLLNDIVDISGDYYNFHNTYFLADSIASFNPETGNGEISWQRNIYGTRQAFNNTLAFLETTEGNEFPGIEYAAHPALPFSIEFVSPKTIRLRAQSGPQFHKREPSLMLDGEVPSDNSWKVSKTKGGYIYKSEFGSVEIINNPWHIVIRDADGKLLTKTRHKADTKTFTPVIPFSYVRRASDYSRSFAAVFTLEPGEKIYGCGESFGKLDKRGQRVYLWMDDANGVQNESMYKAIPFFMSSRGYGMFMHTSTPITCDFGATFNGTNTLMIGDDELDLFIFLGSPKDILDEYTDLTGKSPMPPLWSFGLWMSRITYFSQEEGYAVADKLRMHKVPADVIHFDTGWFGTDWRCDYKFAADRFSDPEKMIADLKDKGLHICLWQLPYFVPKNTLFKEIIDKDLAVKDLKGNIPYEDAVLDFSNPAAVDWYQDKLAGLLKQGVGAIKVDFGEAAPYTGIYHSGRTGFYEHNLYPLRYNKAAAEITKEITGDNIIWARSAWAGSQRYPLHWGGDAANTNTAMASTLRGGISFGLSGFSFWSHDIGGFVQKTPEELYKRWTPFGLLTSHSRCHGAPPKEPWEYSESFLNEFRMADNMRYKLMPYIYAQAKQCTEKGLPMVRALFVEFPDDPGSWLVEDQYLFGSDILVAPLMESNITGRDVYLPPGKWIDYQTGKTYASGWHQIEAGEIPVVMLVRNGSVLPHVKLAQSTMDIDWSKIDLQVYSDGSQQEVKGLVCLPEDNVLKEIAVKQESGKYSLKSDPFNKKIKFSIKQAN